MRSVSRQHRPVVVGGVEEEVASVVADSRLVGVLAAAGSLASSARRPRSIACSKRSTSRSSSTSDPMRYWPSTNSTIGVDVMEARVRRSALSATCNRFRARSGSRPARRPRGARHGTPTASAGPGDTSRSPVPDGRSIARPAPRPPRPPTDRADGRSARCLGRRPAHLRSVRPVRRRRRRRDLLPGGDRCRRGASSATSVVGSSVTTSAIGGTRRSGGTRGRAADRGAERPGPARAQPIPVVAQRGEPRARDRDRTTRPPTCRSPRARASRRAPSPPASSRPRGRIGARHLVVPERPTASSPAER